jgi:hypothetical protein
LQKVVLYPGNFSARYGRVSGGVIELRARDPRTDTFHAVADANVIDSSALIETPLGQDWAIAAAGRRSNLDFFFDKVVPKNAYSVLAAPIYYDYQGIAAHHFGPSGHSEVRFLVYGSRDTIQLFFSHPNEADPALSGSVGGTAEFHRVQAELDTELAPRATQTTSATFGWIRSDQLFGELQQSFKGYEFHGRSEWKVEITPSLSATAGGDLFGWILDGTYRGPQPGQIEGDPRQNDPFFGRRTIAAEVHGLHIIRPAGYLELGIRPVPELLLVPAVRADYFGDIHRTSVDPRLAVRYELAAETALKGGAGIYTQAPEFWQPLPEVGNPHIAPYHAFQSSAGIEQSFGSVFKLGIEGFYKYLYDRIVSATDAGPPYAVNDGDGRIYGAELSAEAHPSENSFGYVAYTLSRSERRDHGGPTRLFDLDQTHVLSVAGSQRLGKGFTLGARFRLTSGNPTTAVVGSTFDARTGLYVPLYGPTNGDRNPTFQQLDVRLEKAFAIGRGSLSAYLEVMNVYNAANPEGFRYSYDYSQRQVVRGLPILPNIGLRGEL